ncbi:aminopeptidase [Flavobacterium sp. NRK F10]|uniref:C1 family peptidase n=1 Tax=Flavobacterium sp. NRK F10 TaxID=2954931 RepID=UPI0020919FF5|nr:C1 family peptidase [Flavobacterium sp. NRK F10]MCO6173459.1 aminopeptidase [Flavobacterium sp. NRK F10]
MKKIQISFISLLTGFCSFAQSYDFKEVIDLDHLPVISQDRTGTCWSFSTSSFLESEIIKKTGKHIDLSEMYQVRTTYPKKAENFVMRQGKAQFSEGALAHDVINSMKDFGLVPVSVFTGLSEEEKIHNHAELAAVLEAMVKTYVENPAKKLSPKWKDAVSKVLDTYLGEVPSEFMYEGKKYTPKSFLDYTKLNADEYVTLTSFTNHPFYEPFILNIPDNFSNGSMYNLPLDEFMKAIDHALESGYTLALDCDVSEKTFSAKYGVAFIPENEEDEKNGLTEIVAEKTITPEYRQDEFENFDTTDDHLMHIVGKLQDQKGNVYYKVKNSWGSDEKRVKNGGYVYMSAAYLQLKSISVLVNKNGIDKKLKKSLNL